MKSILNLISSIPPMWTWFKSGEYNADFDKMLNDVMDRGVDQVKNYDPYREVLFFERFGVGVMYYYGHLYGVKIKCISPTRCSKHTMGRLKNFIKEYDKHLRNKQIKEIMES